MANRPQDYVTPNGRMTTNSVEGFHGLALMYRGKQIDLEHTHYTCKMNMAVCHKVYTCNACKMYISATPYTCIHICIYVHIQYIHVHTCTSNVHLISQNIGPVWKALCCMRMGVPMPRQALQNILREQKLWKKQREFRSRNNYIHRR